MCTITKWSIYLEKLYKHLKANCLKNSNMASFIVGHSWVNDQNIIFHILMNNRWAYKTSNAIFEFFRVSRTICLKIGPNHIMILFSNKCSLFWDSQHSQFRFGVQIPLNFVIFIIIKLLCAILTVVGIGSWCFHMTLLFEIIRMFLCSYTFCIICWNSERPFTGK